MRISDAAVLLALLATACGGPADRTANGAAIARVEADAGNAAEDDGRILCAHGSAPLQRSCTVEQTEVRDAGGAMPRLILTLRHADGGFRRLAVTRDGRGVVAADGADVAAVSVIGPGDIEVRLGDDRYRLPATVKPTARPS